MTRHDILVKKKSHIHARTLAFWSLIAAVLLCSPLAVGSLAASQDLQLSSAEGNVAALSVPLDIRQSKSWKKAGGAGIDYLPAITGKFTNEGPTAATVIVFAVAAVEGATPKLTALRESRGHYELAVESGAAPQSGRNYPDPSRWDGGIQVGSAQAPVLLEVKLRPGQKVDVNTLSLQNQKQIGAMMAAGAIRLGILAIADLNRDATAAAIEVGYALFDMQFSSEGSPARLQFLDADGAFFPGDVFSALRLTSAGSK